MPKPIASRSGRKTDTTRNAARIVPALLDWFAANARDLPWRRTADPYAIWVSEIMLQQTQVKTVIPYWERWVRELPTLRSLARARPEKIHKLWEGLGYYTRVRNMQRAAQIIVADHGDRFPESFEQILSLPGIGRYTAGAICSIAFNQPTPILDGNVTRVLCRVFGICSDPREKKHNTALWQLAEDLVLTASKRTSATRGKRNPAVLPGDYSNSGTGILPVLRDEDRLEALSHCKSRPQERLGVRTVVQNKAVNACSTLNQSLMELGALICTPRNPACDQCPIRPHCVASRTNRVHQLPRAARRPAVTRKNFVAFVVHHRGRYLVQQRPANAVNAHLWEFPNVEITPAKPQLSLVAHRHLGLLPESIRPLKTIRHSITRYRITLDAVTAELSTRPKANGIGRWHHLEKLRELPFTAAHRKILDALPVRPAD